MAEIKTTAEVFAQCIGILQNCGIYSWNTVGKLHSDITGITRDGRFLAVVCKAPGEQPSKAQSDFLSDIMMNRGISILAHSAEELVRGLYAFAAIDSDTWSRLMHGLI